MKRVPLWIGLAALIMLPVAAVAQSSGFSFAPTRASTVAAPVDLLFNVILGISTVIAGSVCLLILFFAFKYRRGSRADRSNPPTSNLKLELSWIFIPILISLAVYVWASRLYFDMYRTPTGALEVFVVGKQWMWKLQHAEGQREINELHIPIGRPIKLTMTSEDVIHSFFVPAFRIKQDVVPGRYTSAWFQATLPGRYHLFCAQYCGMNHASMQGWVYAMKPADYQAWLGQGNPQPSLASQGAKLYEALGCSGCHGNSRAVRAPSLSGLYGKPVPLKSKQIVLADDRYIHDSIVLPGSEIVAGYENIMPSYKGQITEEQIVQLTAYIRSLGESPAREAQTIIKKPLAQPGVQVQRQSVKARLQELHSSQGGENP